MTYTKLTLQFDSAWILSKRGERTLPVEALIGYLQEAFGAEVAITDTSLISLSATIKSSTLDKETIGSRIQRILKDKLAVPQTGNVAKISLDEVEGVPAQEAQTPQAAPEKMPEKTPAVKSPEAAGEPALARIEKLLGADEFKALARELATVAPNLKARGTEDTFARQSYLFSINEGHGLTTYLNLLAALVGELSLMEISSTTPVREVKLDPPKKQQQDMTLDQKAAALTSGKGGAILCIDISEWLSELGGREFRAFLTALYKDAGKNIYIFRVPFVEKEVLAGISRTLGDVMSIRAVSIFPFDFEELKQYADALITGKGFSMREDAWDVLSVRIAEEKSDGRFYGFSTIEKVVGEMLYKKQLHDARKGQNETEIAGNDIRDLAQAQTENRQGLALLDDFIGIDGVKKRIMEIVAQIEASVNNKKLGAPCMHMRFVGNPGTGKTTVARVIGKILKEKGVLRFGNFFEYSGRDFCGRYVGETAPKTAAMCRDAYGSVLFIDEAYSLYREGDYSGDYGREALDTLIAEMENHRGDMVVIMAGYPDEMEHLMKGNAGLASRMPFLIEFPNYTRTQLAGIFLGMAGKAFACGEGFEEAVRAFFEGLPEEFVSAKEFANARFARNLYERTWGKAAMRAQMEKTGAITLTREDFAAASADRDFSFEKRGKKRALGF